MNASTNPATTRQTTLWTPTSAQPSWTRITNTSRPDSPSCATANQLVFPTRTMFHCHKTSTRRPISRRQSMDHHNPNGAHRRQHRLLIINNSRPLHHRYTLVAAGSRDWQICMFPEARLLSRPGHRPSTMRATGPGEICRHDNRAPDQTIPATKILIVTHPCIDPCRLRQEYAVQCPTRTGLVTAMARHRHSRRVRRRRLRSHSSSRRRHLRTESLIQTLGDRTSIHLRQASAHRRAAPFHRTAA